MTLSNLLDDKTGPHTKWFLEELSLHLFIQYMYVQYYIEFFVGVSVQGRGVPHQRHNQQNPQHFRLSQVEGNIKPTLNTNTH